MPRDPKRLVDEDIAAMFTTQGRSYGIDESVAEAAGLKRIMERIQRLDKESQKGKLLKVEEYRWYSALPMTKQEDIRKQAREKGLPLPDAVHENFKRATRN